MDRGNIKTANGARQESTITNYSDSCVTRRVDTDRDQDRVGDERRVVIVENGNNQSSDSKTFTSGDLTAIPVPVDEFEDDLDVPLGNNTRELDEPVEYFLLDDSPMARFARSVKWAYKKLPVGGGGAVLVLSELESMASRQQREIAQQRRLLEQREARLALLRGAQEPAQQERLARLRHRLDQQQSKLNRLRLLRSQTDQSRANNATLTSDLDCIRALFNEKEKELSLAVAKVEELTRQLEELRGRHNGNAGGSAVGGQVPSTASAELEKLRRELMFRNKMNEQQNQVVSQQRLVLAQRQAEMVSIDARIAQLQGRLQRKRALNQRLLTQQQIANNHHQMSSASTITTSSTSTTMTPCLTDQFNKHHQDFITTSTNNNNNNNSNNNNNNINSNNNYNNNNNNNNNKLRPAGNIAAIEPYSHIPNNDNNENNFSINKNDPKYQTLPYNTKFTVNLKPIEDDVNKNNSNKIQHSQSASQIGQRATLQQLEQQIAHSQSQSHIQGQSQLLGINQPSVQLQQLSQPQHTTPQTFPPQSGNFIVHSSNNSNNNSTSITTTATSNSVTNNNLINNQSNDNQNLGSARVPAHQKQVPPASLNQDKSSSASGTQSHNHRNLQTHAKPVSSVAPSFPVKSPIYQTSSTKIHPVMPQTLSLIGRGHPGPQMQIQSYAERSNAQNLVQNQNSTAATTPADATTVTTTTYPRHTFAPGLTGSNYVKNPLNNFPQASLSSLAGANFPGYPAPMGFNQTTAASTPAVTTSSETLDTSRPKFDKKPGGNPQTGANEEVRFDKHENGSIHQTSHQFGTKPHEGLDNLITRTVKYEHNSQYKYDPTNFQQFKQQEINKYSEPASVKEHSVPITTTAHKFEVKHDHSAKLEPPGKIPDKLYEYERTKPENESRKTGNLIENKCEDKMKPALPPKPIKPNPPPRLNSQDKPEVVDTIVAEGVKSPGAFTRNDKEEEIPPIPTSEPPPDSPNEVPTVGNHQIIKARPLTLKKVLLSEQPRLRYSKSNVHVSINRRIEMPPAFLFPETEIPADLMQTEQQQQQQSVVSSDVIDHSSLKAPALTDDELPCNEKLEDSDIVEALNVINIEDKLKKDGSAQDRKTEPDNTDGKAEVIRRKKGNLKSTTGKANLSRRVSFDPLALLLDASLEGELELVKKTAQEVSNPSSANDEGITALHNAICAGHLDIVKFLVEFGCDVNAQDSDGWTPLHCAASCNNLAMVKFLVEHGACIFATTWSDHETAAEKCEEDEEGFDGCSEYLYSVQEKLGIMNNGQVYAVFEYEAQHNDELSLKFGDQLEIIRKGDDNEREWWWSRLGHREGYVPRNFLGLFPRVLPSKSE